MTADRDNPYPAAVEDIMATAASICAAQGMAREVALLAVASG
jgi:hypothetical protein